MSLSDVDKLALSVLLDIVGTMGFDRQGQSEAESLVSAGYKDVLDHVKEKQGDGGPLDGVCASSFVFGYYLCMVVRLPNTMDILNAQDKRDLLDALG